LIFVTIGSLLPFDRLVRAADELAPSFPGERFRAQIGEGAYAPVNMAFDRFLSAKAFSEAVAEAKLIVAHAGMGSLITAAEAAKPIVILPRRLALDEISTDHQVATAKRLGQRPGVHLALDETELAPAIARALAEVDQGAGLPTRAPAAFLQRIKDFIHEA
jgi:UDP-N-acetylglucosamine transferase subunit ALG13